MRILKTLAGAAVAAVLSMGAASAATCGVGSGLSCIALNGTIYYSGPGGGDPEAVVELAVKDALNLASVDLTLLGKSDDGYGTGGDTSANSGSWTAPDIVSYITVKAANLGYILIDVGGVMSGSWSTAGLLNGGGNQPNLSHISFWSDGSDGGGGTTNPIPLPAAGWLMLAGLGGIAAMRRRK